MVKSVDEKYESVLKRLNVDSSNSWLKERVLAQLKEELHKRTIQYIWKYMTDEQLEHFKEFSRESVIVSPEMSEAEILIDFALLYDDLAGKVSDELDVFVEKFVAEVNK